jgi:hypothetical protein
MKFKDPMCKSQLSFQFVLLALLLTVTQSGFADPLNFGNNFFVTGDYIVAGAYGMTTKFTTINGVSYAVGTINVPDQNKGVSNPGIQGATSVPKGAQVIAALLYWQTVEKVAAPGSGKNGYFLPLANASSFAKGFPGYAIQGTNVTGSKSVSWSSGGCGGTSTGKQLVTYRADVAGGLPVDTSNTGNSGNSLANGSFQVLLPSTGNSTPLTLGATLVVIYRIPTGADGPNIPLNSIVIYDGDYAQSNAQLTMTQPLKGFYDADTNPVSRLTHIVGSGQSNKFQTVYLQSGTGKLLALPFLYGNKLPAFPGWYGTWDNTTWTFTNASTTSPGILEDAPNATTQVVPSMSNQGCVSWGAVIVSTTVKNSDGDGILDSWKTNQGYCDVSVNPSCAVGDSAWVDLSGAKHKQKDVFLQYDYMCSSVTGTGKCDSNIAKDLLSAVTAGPPGNTTYTGTISHTLSAGTLVGIAGFTNPANEGQFTVVSSTTTQLVVNNPSGVAEADRTGVATYAIPGDPNYSFDPGLAIDPFNVLTVNDKTAVDKVVASYGSGSHHTPIVLHAIPGNAILENQSNISCSDSSLPPSCVFPNEPGTVGFRAGLASIKNTNIETTTGVIGGCTPGTGDPTCVPVFQHGKKDSYHYALFSHGVGTPTLFLSDGSIKSVQQTGSTVTFTTTLPHGISQIKAQPNYATATDTLCPNGRVTVILAITNTNLNGTFCVLSTPAPTATTFSITVNGSVPSFIYTSKTDPNLAVGNGQVTSISGLSDLGGADSVISLGYGGWGPPTNPFADGNQWQDKAGTFMHELGHTMFLTHGGTFFNNLPGSNPPDYTPTFEANCKPNLQSNMSYLFQFDLLQARGQINPDGTPLKVVDYSEEALTTLVESTPTGAGVLSGAFYATTAWFELQSYDKSGPLMSTHCDFTPLLGSDPATVAVPPSPVSLFGWSSTSGEDINFNGTSTDVMHGHDEWDGTGALGAVGPAPGIDLLQVSALGTLSAVGLGGEQGGLKPSGGGLKPSGGGLKPSGGGLKPSGGAEMTHEQACSYPRPPQNLIAQEEASKRFIDLSWLAPTVCQPVNYNIYRTVVGTPFPTTPLTSVSGTQTTYQDTVTCNPLGYSYRVTAVENNAGTLLESVPSNTVSSGSDGLLTGCYNVTGPSPSAPSSAVQGSLVPITWTLLDDYNVHNNPVTNLFANTLVANGPMPGSCGTSGPTKILLNGIPQNIGQSVASSITNSNTGQFTFNWDTDGFCAGSYTFTLTLDSTQTQTSSSSLQLGIDVGDTDSTPHITTLSVPDATVDTSYSVPLTEEGGVGSVSWSLSSGSLPPNITLPSGGTLSGTPIVPPPGQLNFTSQTSNFTVQVTDSATPTPNMGTQAFTLRLITPVSFKAATYNTGLSPLGVIAAHFTNSGNLDLAIANSVGNTVSILLGNGDGTFTAQPTLATGSVPYSLAAGYFDNDLNLDLVVTNFANGSPSTVSVFLGNGNGTFQLPVTYAVGAGPISVVTGDFNGDHFVDLAVANQNGHSVSILLGNGDGTFQPHVDYQAGTTDVAGLATGDFNGDNKLDLAVANPSSDTVSVPLGNGDGTFAAPVTYATGNSGDHPVAVSAVDLNGDTKLDLAVTNLNAKNVAILLGNGDSNGTFQSRVVYPTTIGNNTGPTAMTTGDFNGDGTVDLAIAEQANNRVSVLLGNGNGSFQSPLEFSTGNFAAGVAAGDFNSDGRLDLAVANQTDGMVSVMLHLPQPPTNLAATGVTTPAPQVTLTWSASRTVPVAHYNVYRATASGGYTLGTPLISLSGNVLTYADNNVTDGTTYYYVVTAVDAGSLESVNSNEVFAAP